MNKYFKMNLNAIWFVDDERGVAIAVVRDSEFFANILYTQNVGDGAFIEPDIAIIFHMSLAIGC